MDLYKSQVQAATSKFQDYQLEGVKPKKVQVALRDAEGGVGEAFSAFVVQSIQDDGSLSAPQYYKPSNDIGTDGLPMMELIANPESIVEISLSKTGTPNDFSSKSVFQNFKMYYQVCKLHTEPNTPNTCLLYTSPSPRD